MAEFSGHFFFTLPRQVGHRYDPAHGRKTELLPVFTDKLKSQ